MMKEDNFPKKVKIGVTTYRIKVRNKIKDRNGWKFWESANIDGQINYPSKLIEIRKDKPSKMKKVLYHEIGHGVCYELAKKYIEFLRWKNNERFIDMFGSVLRRIKLG